MKHLVIVCPHCRRVKKFSEWVEIPKKLDYALAKKDIDEMSLCCPDCRKTHGNTNRLLPLVDKSERSLLAQI